MYLWIVPTFTSILGLAVSGYVELEPETKEDAEVGDKTIATKQLG